MKKWTIWTEMKIIWTQIIFEQRKKIIEISQWNAYKNKHIQYTAKVTIKKNCIKSLTDFKFRKWFTLKRWARLDFDPNHNKCEACCLYNEVSTYLMVY